MQNKGRGRNLPELEILRHSLNQSSDCSGQAWLQDLCSEKSVKTKQL